MSDDDRCAELREALEAARAELSALSADRPGPFLGSAPYAHNPVLRPTTVDEPSMPPEDLRRRVAQLEQAVRECDGE